jgi:hypothetical protein
VDRIVPCNPTSLRLRSGPPERPPGSRTRPKDPEDRGCRTGGEEVLSPGVEGAAGGASGRDRWRGEGVPSLGILHLVTNHRSDHPAREGVEDRPRWRRTTPNASVPRGGVRRAGSSQESLGKPSSPESFEPRETTSFPSTTLVPRDFLKLSRGPIKLLSGDGGRIRGGVDRRIPLSQPGVWIETSRLRALTGRKP